MPKVLKEKDKKKRKTKRLKDPEDNAKRRAKDQETLLEDVKTGEEIGKTVAPEVFDPETFKELTPAQQAATQEYLDTLKAGQSGLTAVENQAIREAAGRELQARLATQNRQLALANARSGVRGAAATAGARDLSREAIEAQRRQEQDLLIQNIAIQDARRAQYGDALNQNSALLANYDQLNAENRLKRAAALAAARSGGLNLLQGRRSRRESRRRFDVSSKIAKTAAANAAAANIGIAERLASLAGLDTNLGGGQISPDLDVSAGLIESAGGSDNFGTITGSSNGVVNKKVSPAHTLTGSYQSKYLK